jgi:hypothetical protein
LEVTSERLGVPVGTEQQYPWNHIEGSLAGAPDVTLQTREDIVPYSLPENLVDMVGWQVKLGSEIRPKKDKGLASLY